MFWRLDKCLLVVVSLRERTTECRGPAPTVTKFGFSLAWTRVQHVQEDNAAFPVGVTYAAASQLGCSLLARQGCRLRLPPLTLGAGGKRGLGRRQVLQL